VVTTEPHQVDVVVTDPGNGFHVEKVADSNALETNLSESGRGISLMRGLMTEVTYHRGGAEVHLKKTLSAAHCADTPLVSRLAV
jgi:anti-sigma regulatory factor (Ser/Thr protein kinase)